ncbi:unnamed protein product [Candidula unifasciata]|uniref:RING-type domain-containing protein n=1 Tax=Candidula unifasciata TaxID=100452 RepID=A0A8S3ZGA3_9EUPU|nr:unnamed protein product [Candidula unifasciata]
MVEAEINFKNIFPEHWSLFLRCTICFGYLHDPHTLECGHTFCKRCLKRLAEIAQEDNVDVRVRRLSLSCPTCRHPFPAKPVLTGRICTCIVLKHMVELWKRECKLLASSSLVTLRSICTQTSDSTPGTDSDEVKASDSRCYEHEEFTVRIRPMDQYCEAVMKRVSESTEDIEPDPQDSIFPKATITYTASVGLITNHHENGPSDSESSSPTDNEASNTSSSHSNASVPEIFGHMNIPRFTFTQCTPGHFLLMLVWCMYSVIIVGLAEAFLPYIILFTLFFFLVILG